MAKSNMQIILNGVDLDDLRSTVIKIIGQKELLTNAATTRARATGKTPARATETIPAKATGGTPTKAMGGTPASASASASATGGYELEALELLRTQVGDMEVDDDL